jgi:hypothetical protein
MSDDNLVYLLRRAAEERARATNSKHDSVRIAHTNLAEAYEKRLGEQAPSNDPG